MKRFFPWQRCKSVARVGLFFFLACAIALALIQEDPWLKKHLESRISLIFNQEFACHFTADLAQLHLLYGSCTLHNVTAYEKTTQKNPTWQWHADTVTITWSWLDIVWRGSAGLHVRFSGFSCYSECDIYGNCAIAEHCRRLAAPTDLAVPFDLASFAIRNGRLQLQDPHDQKRGYAGEFLFALDAFIVSDALHASMRFADGTLHKSDQDLLVNATGSSFIFLPIHAQSTATKATKRSDKITVEAHVDFAQLPEQIKKVTLQAEWEGGEGFCRLWNQDETLQGLLSLDDYHVCNALFMVPLVYGYSLLCVDEQPDVQGMVQVACECDLLALRDTLKLRSVAHNMRYSGNALPDVFATAHAQEGGKIMGAVIVGSEDESLVTGSWELDFKTLELTGHASVKKIMEQQEHPLSFEFNSTQGSCAILATCNNQGLSAACRGDGRVTATCDYGFVRSILQMMQYDVAGEGTIAFEGTYADKKFDLSCVMEDASIRLPSTYSVIKKCKGKLVGDLAAGHYCCKDITIDLYKGTLACSEATVDLTRSGRLAFLHCPVVLRNCFLSWKKDIFAQVSGALVVTASSQEQIDVAGQLVLDQSYMRGNILSAEFQQELFGSAVDSLVASVRQQAGQAGALNCTCDISLINRSPIEITTPFLQALAKADVHLGGSLTDLQVSGTLDLLSGRLDFPYKPLFITRGKITFLPQCLDDPRIDLVARNTIKKYAVEMQVVGSARNPVVTFSSSPYLSRDQIITLLLGGSDDGALYLVMPHVITDTLEHLLFGSAEVSSRVQKYLKSLFKPLKSIRILPNITDQKGRGGVRGSVDFEVNDRLHAKFEKNFSLTEDATFEVEYLISDDSSVRVLKDERGDLGLEGQMRWKF